MIGPHVKRACLTAALGVLLVLAGLPVPDAAACHKYVSARTGAKGCAAWRADRKAKKSSRSSSSKSSSPVRRVASSSPSSASGSAASALVAPAGNAPRSRLQWNGEWIGGSPTAATQLFPVPVGVPRARTSGRAAAALRVRIRETGTLVGVSVLVRMNRPWTKDSKGTYGGYSIGDGGSAVIEIRRLTNRNSPDPRDWLPDMSASGLLAVTEVNGQRSIPNMRAKFLEQYLTRGRRRTTPMWEWKLTKPLPVRAGDLLALVIRHVGSGPVNTRFSINANGLYGAPSWNSKPFGRNGPVFGDLETFLYSSSGTRWSARGTTEAWHPVYALVYANGDVRGWPAPTGNSSCRDRIGGRSWARMKMTIPSRYPRLNVREIWLAAFRQTAGSGSLVVELRDAGMKVLNSTTIPASRFSLGVPTRKEASGTRGGVSWPFPTTTIGPGTYYVVLRSTDRTSYWLQGFSDDSVYISRNMASGVRPLFVDELDHRKGSFTIEKSTNGGSSWQRWKGFCEMFPILLRTG